MKSQSVVTDLRKKVFSAVARVAYESENVAGDLEEITFLKQEMRPVSLAYHSETLN